MPRINKLFSLIALTALVGCDGGPIEINGTFTSNFGGTETITEETWDNGFSTTTVEDWDNSANWVVLKNPSDAMFNPDQYSRVVWTEEIDGAFHYCTVAFGLDTLEAAQTSTQTADASNPDMSGCGGFSWTKLTRQ